MAITQVRAQLDGQWYTLIYNEETRAYQATITPASYSGGQPGGYYNVIVEATNDIGTVTTTDGNNIPGLQLVVKETVAPTISLVSPAQGYVTTNTPTIVWTAVDNTGGSGIDPDTAAVTVDGAPTSGVIVSADTGGAYTVSFTPSSALAEGTRSIQVSISDNDGNTVTNTAVYVVDTVPPQLSAGLSVDHAVTDAYTVVLTGQTNDATAPPVTVSVLNNGVSPGPVTVGTDGTFSLTIPLDVGENNGTVTAMDEAGLSTTQSFYFIRLITDRTQDDVDRATELTAKGLAGMTAEEKAEYNALVKGAYNYTDLNRVNTAMEHLHEWLTEAGYNTGFADQNITWQESSVPTVSQTAVFLSNVEAIGDMFPLQDPPTIPKTLEAFIYTGANNIEEILVMTDRVQPLLTRSPFYSSEIFCGEV